MPEVRTSNVQLSFGGGMNHEVDPDKLRDDECLVAMNYRIRNGVLETSKGWVPVAAYPPNCELYDWWYKLIKGSAINQINENRWVTDNITSIGFVTGHTTYANLGFPALTPKGAGFLNYLQNDSTIISKKNFTFKPGYSVEAQFDMQGGGASRSFDWGLQEDPDSYTSAVGLRVTVDGLGSIKVYEDGVEVHDFGTSLAHPIDYSGGQRKVRLRFVRLDNGGWRVSHGIHFRSDALNGSYDTTYNSLQQPRLCVHSATPGGIISYQETIYCRDGQGFTDSEITYANQSPTTGLYRFYREHSSPILVATQGSGVYKFESDTFHEISEDFSPGKRGRFDTFQNTLFYANGEDQIQTWTGMGHMRPLGAGHLAAPHAGFIRAHLGRMFAIGDKNSPSRLYWSQLETVSHWDKEGDFLDIGEFEGDSATGLEVLGGNLFVITENSFWRVAGRTPEQFSVLRVPNAPGCIAPESIANTGTAIIYLARDGVYMFDGVNAREISGKIRKIFNGDSPYINVIHSRLRDSVGVYHDFTYRLSIHANGMLEQPVAGINTVPIDPIELNQEEFAGDTDVFELRNVYKGINNVELICDFKSFPSSGELGGWTFNMREVTAYTVQRGSQDNNELIAGVGTTGLVVRFEDGHGRYIDRLTVDGEAQNVTDTYDDSDDNPDFASIGPLIHSEYFLSKHFGGRDPLVLKNWQGCRLKYDIGNDGQATYRWFTNRHHGQKPGVENHQVFNMYDDEDDDEGRHINWQKGHNSLDNSFLLATDVEEFIEVDGEKRYINFLGSPNEVREKWLDHNFENTDGEKFYFSLYRIGSRMPTRITMAQVEFLEHNPDYSGEQDA